MLSLLGKSSPLCDGLSRREMMRVGGLSLGGLSLAAMLKNNALAKQQPGLSSKPGFGKAKSVILFGLTGGLPQHETWDPKPDAPEEIRGEFGSIASKTPGLRVGELMPLTAQLTDKIAVLRAMVTGDNSHSSSGYQMLTGIEHQPLNRESGPTGPPNDHPSLGAMVRALKRDKGQLPSAVTIPEHIWNDGNKPWPGQDAGFLGRRHDPWLIKCYPHEDRIDVPGMTLPNDISRLRLDARQTLLQQFNQQARTLQESLAIENYDVQTQQAYGLLGSGNTTSAFDMKQESDATRDAYGRTRFGQSCLLARRLVEAGVSLVQVNWARIKKDGYENQGGWDTHAKHSFSLKQHLMPSMDQTFSALIEDLDRRGLLEETLVVMFCEFGHTPKFNKNAGRDHWGQAFSIALAGGGVQGGVVHGSTDKHAASAVDGMVRPRDFIATVFHLLGFAPHTEIHDPFNRPIPLSRGRVIEQIL
ncbi:MAG: hypothetical protein CMJ73_07025 [Planctomycetaceae bacterium]|nr:hypothetical protein [Planctomycetaceae bacterium]